MGMGVVVAMVVVVMAYTTNVAHSGGCSVCLTSAKWRLVIIYLCLNWEKWLQPLGQGVDKRQRNFFLFCFCWKFFFSNSNISLECVRFLHNMSLPFATVFGVCF